MAIASLETASLAIPFREPYETARGRLERREVVLVRIHTHDGPTGLGEAVPLTLRGGPDLAAIVAELSSCKPALAGAELEPKSAAGAGVAIAELVERCRARGAGRQSLAAVDVALHDLAGKLLGEPVWRLLGAPDAGPVVCNATLVAGPPDRVAERARAAASRGFGTFKLKVGVPGDVEAVASVREAVGEPARIRVDANGAWSPEQGLERLGRMEPHRIELVEQPAPDIAGLAEVRAGTPIPVVADESVAGATDARRAVELDACDAATVKIAKVGGIAAALSVADVLPVYLSSALDGPIGIAAAVHAAQALPRDGRAAELAHGLATQELFAVDLAHRAPVVEGGRIAPPDAPGLGVEIDEAALARVHL